MSRDISTDVFEATVVAGGIRTCYQAAGRGPAVLVLTTCPSRRAALLDAVPRRIRVVAPTPPAAFEFAPTHDASRQDPRREDEMHREFAAWIDGLLEALGLSRVWLVADTPFAASARVYARVSPDRVRGLVVLHGSEE